MTMLKQAFLDMCDTYNKLTVNEFVRGIRERDMAMKKMSVLSKLREGLDVEIKSGDRLI